jgi:hypothetical protein
LSLPFLHPFLQPSFGSCPSVKMADTQQMWVQFGRAVGLTCVLSFVWAMVGLLLVLMGKGKSSTTGKYKKRYTVVPATVLSIALVRSFCCRFVSFCKFSLLFHSGLDVLLCAAPCRWLLEPCAARQAACWSV